MSLTLTVASHPLLEVGAFVSRYSKPLGDLTLAPRAAPFASDDAIRTAVRDLLRAGGFKPSGRSKPASEYLVAAHAEGRFPAINAAVDACNLASLASGLPISLVDVDKLDGALSIRCADPKTSYVFNPSGQVIDASGLLCLFDAQGPSGTPVKDAQRTKTDEHTRAALSIVWGTSALPGRTAQATAWYRELCATIATVEDVALR
jgi:DNA/RNA-binding domain of Phe-tRNA-synthetase-like protein